MGDNGWAFVRWLVLVWCGAAVCSSLLAGCVFGARLTWIPGVAGAVGGGLLAYQIRKHWPGDESETDR